MHLYTKRLNLQSVDSGLLYLIIYIRRSKLKPKLAKWDSNYFFFD